MGAWAEKPWAKGHISAGGYLSLAFRESGGFPEHSGGYEVMLGFSHPWFRVGMGSGVGSGGETFFLLRAI